MKKIKKLEKKRITLCITYNENTNLLIMKKYKENKYVNDNNKKVYSI